MHLQNTKPSFKAKFFYDINFVLCILLNGLRTILMSHFRWKKNQNVQYLQVFKIEVECKILHFMKPHLIYFKRYQMRFHKELTPLFYLQVNLCQKLLFLHQLTHNMTTDCSWNYHENYNSTTEHGQKNNLLSYCGLVDARISASEKDLPVWLVQHSQRIPWYLS